MLAAAIAAQKRPRSIPPLRPDDTWECPAGTGMTLTQDRHCDTVIVVNCYVVGLQVGSIITLNEATYEVAARAMPSGRRRLAAKLPITLATPLTGDATSGASAKASYPSCLPPPSCRVPPWSRFCSPPPSCLSSSS